MSLVLTLNQSWVDGALKEETSEESAGELGRWAQPLSRGPEDLSLSSRTHAKCQAGQRVLETQAVGDGRQKRDLWGSPASQPTCWSSRLMRDPFSNKNWKAPEKWHPGFVLWPPTRMHTSYKDSLTHLVCFRTQLWPAKERLEHPAWTSPPHHRTWDAPHRRTGALCPSQEMGRSGPSREFSELAVDTAGESLCIVSVEGATHNTLSLSARSPSHPQNFPWPWQISMWNTYTNQTFTDNKSQRFVLK